MTNDVVEHPAHYQGAYGVECMDVIANLLDRVDGLNGTEKYWYGCAVKYLYRWPLKNGTEDLRKAEQCIEYLLDALRMDDERCEDDADFCSL